jgi:hypothetical protein
MLKLEEKDLGLEIQKLFAVLKNFLNPENKIGDCLLDILDILFLLKANGYSNGTEIVKNTFKDFETLTALSDKEKESIIKSKIFKRLFDMLVWDQLIIADIIGNIVKNLCDVTNVTLKQDIYYNISEIFNDQIVYLTSCITASNKDKGKNANKKKLDPSSSSSSSPPPSPSSSSSSPPPSPSSSSSSPPPPPPSPSSSGNNLLIPPEPSQNQLDNLSPSSSSSSSSSSLSDLFSMYNQDHLIFKLFESIDMLCRSSKEISFIFFENYASKLFDILNDLFKLGVGSDDTFHIQEAIIKIFASVIRNAEGDKYKSFISNKLIPFLLELFDQDVSSNQLSHPITLIVEICSILNRITIYGCSFTGGNAFFKTFEDKGRFTTILDFFVMITAFRHSIVPPPPLPRGRSSSPTVSSSSPPPSSFSVRGKYMSFQALKTQYQKEYASVSLLKEYDLIMQYIPLAVLNLYKGKQLPTSTFEYLSIVLAMSISKLKTERENWAELAKFAWKAPTDSDKKYYCYLITQSSVIPAI